jgi:hypothetical protein
MDQRFEILMDKGMRDYVDIAARRAGINASAWVRMQVARELTACFGDKWQDHPEGDHGEKVQVSGK